MTPYHRYWNEKYRRNPLGSAHEKIRWSHTVQVPGNIGDKKRGFKRFDRWYKLPRAAHRLYWRLRARSEA